MRWLKPRSGAWRKFGLVVFLWWVLFDLLEVDYYGEVYSFSCGAGR